MAANGKKYELLLAKLCSLCGIATEYNNFWEHPCKVSTQTQAALLAATGIPIENNEGALRATLDELSARPWRQRLPGVKVVREDESLTHIPLRLPADQSNHTFRWTLTAENGKTHSDSFRPGDLDIVGQREIGGTVFVHYHLSVAHACKSGYHRFTLEPACDDQPASMQLIVAPMSCYQPHALKGDRRVWGPALQLYSVASEHNWGIGDFTDLKRLTDLCGQNGAGILGINPLHSLFPHNPAQASPYSPSSRLFLNSLYIDVEAVAEFADCAPVRQQVSSPEFQAQLAKLRAADLIQYDTIGRTKFAILKQLHQHFRDHHLTSDTPRARAFRAFQAQGGEALFKQALYEALQAHFASEAPTLWSWPVWPEAYRSVTSPAVADFTANHSIEIEFYQYLQWEADRQLDGAAQHSWVVGLGVGLYQELAVSIDRGGAEAWANQGLYALEASIGAPPDEFNLKVQNWGLPPIIPEQLVARAYQPFIATLRCAMRHAGAVRIDHVMALRCMFWVPENTTRDEGSYVHYPFDDLLGILALESQRNQCLVVGDDLGSVPEEVREALTSLGILSHRLFYFEKNAQGDLKPPTQYPRQAVVSAGTHDLPTLAGFWEGRDLVLKERLVLYPSPPMRKAQLLARVQDRTRILLALEQEGLLPKGMGIDPATVPKMTAPLTRAIYLYLARSPAQVMLFQPEGVWGQIDQVNLPGTTDEYPNWRRRLTVSLEAWAEEPRLRTLLDALRRERGASVNKPPPSASAVKNIPRATYRLQFNRNFTFLQAAEIVAYLDELGISHCYSSPYLKARPGSTHGYDIIDHTQLNPEIGTPEEFDRFAETLRSHRMGQLLDIVPNHMGVMGNDNAWWLDVLENGPSARHDFFDIDWNPVKAELRGKVLLPVLGDYYGTVLENGEIKLAFDTERGAFHAHYYEHTFPIDPQTYPMILNHDLNRLESSTEPNDPSILEFESLITAFEHLPRRHETTPEHIDERHRDQQVHKRQLSELCQGVASIAHFVEDNVAAFNASGQNGAQFERLHALLERQAYRLAHWRVAFDEINYRRFFDINELAALRMESSEVFAATHQLIFALIGQGKVQGLRIDHPDGLYNPVRYFSRLQEKIAASTALVSQAGAQTDICNDTHFYVVAEKILASYEQLPQSWPVCGTTGYDFACACNMLLVYGDAERELERIYRGFIGHKLKLDDLLYERKKLIMRTQLASELTMLTKLLSTLAQRDPHTRDYTLLGLREALTQVIACFPVYRTYIADTEISAQDHHYLEWALALARRRSPAADLSIFGFIGDVLLLKNLDEHDSVYCRHALEFIMKFQQYTAPVMAKGLEDTTFYLYNRLISLNEVGGDPRRFGLSVAAFHDTNQERLRLWPHAMLATSTHDAKRSEDVRARIHVLSELVEDWHRHLVRWSRMNRTKKQTVDDYPAPCPNDEYHLYQTLIGVWPLEVVDEPALRALRERIQAYMLKAAREAKMHTSWINRNSAYETAIGHFVDALLGHLEGNAFLADFIPFQKRVSFFGLLNSLSQLLLKLTSPGVPDIYQGQALWGFYLVDPDNRQSVNYDHRQKVLQGLKTLTDRSDDLARQVRQFMGSMTDGRIKLYLTWRVLSLRKENPRLFSEGDYLPLSAQGQRAEHVCAFSRRHQDKHVVVVAPRWFARLTAGRTVSPLGEKVWGDTSVELPEDAPPEYCNILTGERLKPNRFGDRGEIQLADLLRNFSVALLIN